MIQILILKKERVNKMLDLCKLLGVAEGEEFKLVSDNSESKYIIVDNILNLVIGNRPYVSELTINDINAYKLKIIKLPKKKQFTDDELCILRNIDKKYKWIARDKVDRDEYDNYGNLNIYLGKPNKSTVSWLPSDEYCEFHAYNHLFQSIKWEDEEPVCIDDYVER